MKRSRQVFPIGKRSKDTFKVGEYVDINLHGICYQREKIEWKSLLRLGELWLMNDAQEFSH